MLTNIDIDHNKVLEIMKMMNYKTKKEAVNAAIEDYLKKLNRLKVLDWKGTKAWEGDLDKMRQD
jgi:Arc/MetJ family transcription regulator